MASALPLRRTRPRRLVTARITFVLLPVLAWTACDGADAVGSRAQRDTLADGRVVVRYAGIADHLAEAVVPDLRIGSIEGAGAETFGDVRGIEVGPDGTVYVLDFQAAEVRAFGPDGRHVATLARRGEGPGELRQANGLALGPDGTLWVQDHGARSLIGLSPEGQEVARHPMLVNGYGYLWDGVVDRQGVFWQRWAHSDVRFDPGATGLQEGTSRSYYKSWDPRTQAYDSVFLGRTVTRSFRVTFENGSMVMAIPFSPTLLAARDREEGIWIASSNAYRVARLGAGGDTLLVLEVGVDSLAVTAGDRAAWRERMESTFERAPAAREVETFIPDHKPVLAGLQADDLGRLWVQRTVHAGEPPLFDLFTPDAEYLGSVSLPRGLDAYFPPVFRGGHVHALVRDDLDVPYVVRAGIPAFAREGG